MFVLHIRLCWLNLAHSSPAKKPYLSYIFFSQENINCEDKWPLLWIDVRLCLSVDKSFHLQFVKDVTTQSSLFPDIFKQIPIANCKRNIAGPNLNSVDSYFVINRFKLLTVLWLNGETVKLCYIEVLETNWILRYIHNSLYPYYKYKKFTRNKFCILLF